MPVSGDLIRRANTGEMTAAPCSPTQWVMRSAIIDAVRQRLARYRGCCTALEITEALELTNLTAGAIRRRRGGCWVDGPVTERAALPTSAATARLASKAMAGPGVPWR